MAGKAQKTLTFETALLELEQVVGEMEAGKLPLDASLAAYQRGVELLQLCRAKLDGAQQQVQLLDGALLKPFTPEA
jgi:exodeoxyribonuclease VII small subunit